MKTILASILVVAAMAANPVQAQTVDEAVRSIQSDIRSSLVAAPAQPVPLPLNAAISEQGESAVKSVLLDVRLSIYVNSNVAGHYPPAERSGLVTVSELETVEEGNTESVEL